MLKPLTIGALARATATKVETIRYYEMIGLLPRPPRTRGNYRAYDEDDLARLSFVRRARDLGFSVEAVRELLGLHAARRGDCAAVGAIATAHVRAIERKIADLEALAAELKRLMRACRKGKLGTCRVIDALAAPAYRHQVFVLGY
jgi:DNA-binding transcriptional MerR regulator